MQRIADYTFERELGSANYGSWFLARTPARLPLDTEYVVVKVMSAPTRYDTFRRAAKELRAFAAVQSPYLVKLYDAGKQDETFYYAMEYLPLGSLANPGKPLDRATSLTAVECAARAADALHEAGMVHRDLRPDNILLTEDGARLADLGLAQLIQPGITMTGMGSMSFVEYVDPAVLQGGQASRGSDIWSIGVTLHQVLTGKSVYGDLPRHDPLLNLRRVLSTKPEPDAALDEDAAALVRACLEPDPPTRPATAAVVADAIAALPR